MNTGNDPSAALASLLAILSQSTKGQQTTPSSQRHPSHLSLPLEPIFPEGDILETTQWIGVPTTPWYQPREWQLPRTNKPVPIRPPPNKPEPPPPSTRITPVLPPGPLSYSQALKWVIEQSRSDDFIDSLRRMKVRQNNLESDLFEERCRIIRKYESKRKMSELLKSIQGSQCNDEHVQYPPNFRLMKTLLEQERAELMKFDMDLVTKWRELECEQIKEIEGMGVPYFGIEGEEESRAKILDLLEDLISTEEKA
jgi:hypothetical protein